MFSGSLVRRVFNGLPGDEGRAAVELVLRAAGPKARARERDLALRSAAEFVAGDSAAAVARKFLERMGAQSLTFPKYLDAGTVDGRLALALLLSGMELPSEKTIVRALRATEDEDRQDRAVLSAVR